MKFMFVLGMLCAVPLFGDGGTCHFSTIQECAGCKLLSHRASVTSDCTLRPGIDVLAGTMVAWDRSQNIQSISGAAHDLTIQGAIEAKAGSFVAWYPNGQVKFVSELASDSQVGPGIWAAHGASVSWYQSGPVESVSRLARDFHGLTGQDTVHAPNGAYFYEDGSLAFSRPPR